MNLEPSRRFWKSKTRFSVAAILLAAVISGPSASALSISFEVENLPDGSNGDLYRYIYRLSGSSLGANQAFEIGFDHTLYELLEEFPAAANADWNVVTFPIDPILGDGLYSALALIDNPSLSGEFSVSFIWLGNGAPGAQPFQINQFDDSGNFLNNIGEPGVIVPFQPDNGGGGTGVPDGGSAALLTLMGLAGLAAVKRGRG